MGGKEFTQQIEYIVAQIRDAGYEPYDQLIGYAKTGNFNYITRHGNARELIKDIDTNDIRKYLIQKGVKI